MIAKVQCWLFGHVWFYYKTGMLRYLKCERCFRKIYPVGEDRINKGVKK